MGGFSDFLKKAGKVTLDIATLGHGDDVIDVAHDIGHSLGGGAAEDAAREMEQANQSAYDLYGGLLPRAQGAYQPYLDTGRNMFQRYVQGIDQAPKYSSTGDFQFNPSDLQNDPSYQFRLNQGIEALNRGAGASGMLNSGNRLIALQDLGQNMASQEYENAFSRALTTNRENYNRGVQDYGINYGGYRDYLAALGQLGSLGYDTQNLLTNLDLSATEGKANAKLGQGMARASGELGKASAISNTLGDIIGGAGYIYGSNKLAALKGG